MHSQTLQQIPGSTLHFIGMGSSGSNLINALYLKGIQASYTVILNSEREHHETCQVVHYRLPGNRYYKNPNWPAKQLKLTKKITSLFTQDQTYLFLLGLGGTGTVLLHTLIPWLLERKIRFKVLCSFPSHWEGEIRSSTAKVLFDRMNRQPFFECFRVDDLMEIRGNTTIRETFQKADGHFSMIVAKMMNQHT
jgi:hypothetical protein